MGRDIIPCDGPGAVKFLLRSFAVAIRMSVRRCVDGSGVVWVFGDGEGGISASQPTRARRQLQCRNATMAVTIHCAERVMGSVILYLVLVLSWCVLARGGGMEELEGVRLLMLNAR